MRSQQRRSRDSRRRNQGRKPVSRREGPLTSLSWGTRLCFFLSSMSVFTPLFTSLWVYPCPSLSPTLLFSLPRAFCVFLHLSLPQPPFLGFGLYPSLPSAAGGETPGVRGSPAAQAPANLLTSQKQLVGQRAAPPARVMRSSIYFHAGQTIIY